MKRQILLTTVLSTILVGGCYAQPRVSLVDRTTYYGDAESSLWFETASALTKADHYRKKCIAIYGYAKDSPHLPQCVQKELSMRASAYNAEYDRALESFSNSLKHLGGSPKQTIGGSPKQTTCNYIGSTLYCNEW